MKHETLHYIAPTGIGEKERKILADHANEEFYKNNPRCFRIYGRMGAMKKMKPVNKSRFVTNLIYADLYYVRSSEDEAALLKELEFLNKQGVFELREVSL